MTSNIEQQFFKTFGIEPKDYYGCNWDGYCPYDNEFDKCGKHCLYWSKYKNDYPKITAEKLLELIRIMNIYQGKSLIYGQSLNEMKYDILNKCILMHKKGLGIKTEVRALFGGEARNDRN